MANYLDLAGLTAYDGKIKQWFKAGLVDITDNAIRALFVNTLEVPYVTFTAEQDNSSIGLSKLSTNQTLEYSTDTATWNTFDATTNIPLNDGDKVYVRGVLSVDNSSSNYTQFKMSGKIAASGNCNAIWNYRDLNAPLKVYCGYRMFYDCSSLTTAPELPAMVLTDWGYCHMFERCTSLTTAPELPATTLATECYADMFAWCTSLTTVPELPATTLAEGCYTSMFWHCSSITTTPKLPATTLTPGCYSFMFSSCTSITIAPELPATALVYNCYSSMFSNCTKLNYIKCLATDVPDTDCISEWVYGVASTGTFVKHPDMDYWFEIEGIPEGWTVVDAEL